MWTFRHEIDKKCAQRKCDVHGTKKRGEHMRALAYVLVAVGAATTAMGAWWCYTFLILIRYVASTGAETNWLNVILVIVLAAIFSVAPLVVGVALLRRHSRRSPRKVGEANGH